MLTMTSLYNNEKIMMNMVTLTYDEMKTVSFDYIGLRLKNFFQRSKVFKLICAFFGALHPIYHPLSWVRSSF